MKTSDLPADMLQKPKAVIPPRISNVSHPAFSCAAASAGACTVADLCEGSFTRALEHLSDQAVVQRSIKRGGALYRSGDPLVNLYLLRAGSVKVRMVTYGGAEQITAFPMTGELLGLDGIETGIHACDAIALEDSLVCTLPFAPLMAYCANDAKALLRLNRLIAREASDYRRLLFVLAGTNSEERVASFLLETSKQLAARGYSSADFILKMTRDDIAKHLGMKQETVSRVLARLQTAHILDVSRRHLKIRDAVKLAVIACRH